MKGLVYLSGENLPLALGELKGALAALGSPSSVLEGVGPVAILDGPAPSGLATRMGFCHFDGEVSLEAGSDPDSIVRACLHEMMRAAPSSIGFTVKSQKKEDASSLYVRLEEGARSLDIPLDHRNPSFKLFAVTTRTRTFIGCVNGETDRKALLSRRGSKMPFNRPVIMDPRLARAMVNLSGLPPGSRILDPFMGPGGLAIEACHLGISCVGVEIDARIHSGSLLNIDRCSEGSRITAIHGDSRRLTDIIPREFGPFDGIITDPPFGRSASLGGSSSEDLLVDVLTRARPLLKAGAPVVIDMPRPFSWSMGGQYSTTQAYQQRVHRSLTRHVLVMRAA